MESPDTWCGKMSPEHSAQTKGQISPQSSRKQLGSQNRRPPLFLCLKTVGPQQDASQVMEWEENGALLGEYLTHSFGESPSVAVESHLSQILEDQPHPKYYLSARACQGILNRADRRGKPLPPPVEASVVATINNRGAFYGDKTESLRSESHGAIPIAYCIQGNCIDRADTAGCNGRGWTEGVSYTLNTVDRPAVVPLLNDQGGSSISGDDNAKIAPTLRAEMHGNIPAVSYGFKYLQGAKAGNIAYRKEQAPTLQAHQGDAAVFLALENHPQDSRVKIATDNVVQTLSGKMGTGGGNTPMVLKVTQGVDGYNAALTGDKSSTLGANCGMSTGRTGVITMDRAAFNQGQNAKYNIGVDENSVAYTVTAKGPGAVCIGNGQLDQLQMSDVCNTLDCMHDQKAIIEVPLETVRRLTPLECERLQGFPDGWTDIGDWTDSKGKVHKCTDSARYKALGNSISLPNWFYVLQKLTLCCGDDTTMASLFDGIGGFPLIWESLNGKGSCLWASEIEEFPIAVTTTRFEE